MKPATASLLLRPSTTRKTGAKAAAPAGRATNHPIDKRA
jgi:hypothetical protein